MSYYTIGVALYTDTNGMILCDFGVYSHNWSIYDKDICPDIVLPVG